MGKDKDLKWRPSAGEVVRVLAGTTVPPEAVDRLGLVLGLEAWAPGRAKVKLPRATRPAPQPAEGAEGAEPTAETAEAPEDQTLPPMVLLVRPQLLRDAEAGRDPTVPDPAHAALVAAALACADVRDDEEDEEDRPRPKRQAATKGNERRKEQQKQQQVEYERKYAGSGSKRRREARLEEELLYETSDEEEEEEELEEAEVEGEVGEFPGVRAGTWLKRKFRAEEDPSGSSLPGWYFGEVVHHDPARGRHCIFYKKRDNAKLLRESSLHEWVDLRLLWDAKCLKVVSPEGLHSSGECVRMRWWYAYGPAQREMAAAPGAASEGQEEGRVETGAADAAADEAEERGAAPAPALPVVDAGPWELTTLPGDPLPRENRRLELFFGLEWAIGKHLTEEEAAFYVIELVRRASDESAIDFYVRILDDDLKMAASARGVRTEPRTRNELADHFGLGAAEKSAMGAHIDRRIAEAAEVFEERRAIQNAADAAAAAADADADAGEYEPPTSADPTPAKKKRRRGRDNDDDAGDEDYDAMDEDDEDDEEYEDEGTDSDRGGAGGSDDGSDDDDDD